MSPRLKGARNAIVRLETAAYELKDGTVCKRLRLAIRWQAPGDAKVRRYRTSLGIDDTRQNRRAWEPKLRQIERELIIDTSTRPTGLSAIRFSKVPAAIRQHQ